MTRQQIDRMLFLANWLEKNVTEEQFTIGWGKDNVRCAAGWATTIPEFNQEGFIDGYGGGCPIFEDYESLDACEAFFGTYKPFVISGYNDWIDNFNLASIIYKLRSYSY